ncbi:MAG: metallophosphoesterase, partial [bacterium]
LGLIGHSVPLFLAIGNHDGEETFKGGSADAGGLAVWACKQRKLYFSNPEPGDFYGGNAIPDPNAGLRQDYYSWEWGDALLVVLEPYWYSRGTKGGSEPWNMTLGKAQYDWLASTLRASKAKYKFIFIHQLVGGLDKGGRGGSEAAPLFEWGGHEKDGKDTFAVNRPGWGKPIHDILVETGVSAVFHGHDHFFAHQVLDGIVYQLVPQPGHPGDGSIRDARNYGYVSGDTRPGSGHVRVTVSRDRSTVEYVRTHQNRGRDQEANGSVEFSYSIEAGRQAVSLPRP